MSEQNMLKVSMGRADDRSYWMGVSDERHVGVSEGYETDPVEVAKEAGGHGLLDQQERPNRVEED